MYLEKARGLLYCGSIKLKLTFSEKATKFCEIFTLLLSYGVPVKSKVKILQRFVAFSEYMNFTYLKIVEMVQMVSSVPCYFLKKIAPTLVAYSSKFLGLVKFGVSFDLGFIP